MLCLSWNLNAKLPGIILNATDAELAPKTPSFLLALC